MDLRGEQTIFRQQKISVIIPALDEEDSIGRVLDDIPRFVDEVLVVDNGSRDRTAERAGDKGATVLTESRKGYGSACLQGIAHLQPDTDIVVFLDADYSDHPQEMENLLEALAENSWDLVIGSRALGKHEKGALLPVPRFGNWLSTRLLAWAWGFQFTDLGPFRAIRLGALKRLEMSDPDYGWTVQMQARALRVGLLCGEVPVSYRKRIGRSKVSGTVKGSFLAGKKILSTIGREWLADRLANLGRRSGSAA